MKLFNYKCFCIVFVLFDFNQFIIENSWNFLEYFHVRCWGVPNPFQFSVSIVIANWNSVRNHFSKRHSKFEFDCEWLRIRNANSDICGDVIYTPNPRKISLENAKINIERFDNWIELRCMCGACGAGVIHVSLAYCTIGVVSVRSGFNRIAMLFVMSTSACLITYFIFSLI